MREVCGALVRQEPRTLLSVKSGKTKKLGEMKLSMQKLNLGPWHRGDNYAHPLYTPLFMEHYKRQSRGRKRKQGVESGRSTTKIRHLGGMSVGNSIFNKAYDYY